MSTTTAEPPVAAAPEQSPAPAVEESKPTAAEVPAEVKPVEAEAAPEAAPEAAAETAPAAETSAAPEAKAAETAPESAPEPVVAEAPAVEEPKTVADEAAAVPSDAAAEAAPSTPLSKLFAELKSITAEAEYQEMWGVELSDEEHVPSTIVLEKFLRANNKDVAKAKAQLTEALKWRKRLQPAQLLAETEFDASKFGGLGYVTVYPKSDTHEKEIVTWNIYGAVKDNKATFGNIEE